MPADTGTTVLPLPYHIGVVVEEIETTTDFLYSVLDVGPWEILDYTPTRDKLMMGEPYQIKFGAARLGSFLLELLQPVEGESIYSKFIKAYGEGIHHIAFSVPNWDERVSRVKEYGGQMVAGGIGLERRWGYFEVKPGGMIVEFEEQLDGKPLFTLPDTKSKVLRSPEHVCVVVEDIEKASKLLSSIWGLGPWQVMDYISSRHEVTVGPFPMSLRWALAKLETIVLELIQPLTGNTVWAKFLEEHGEGLHHIAFSMPDYDEMVTKLEKQGSQVVFVNSLHGKRSCYIQTKPGGLMLEFAEAGIHRDYYKKL